MFPSSRADMTVVEKKVQFARFFDRFAPRRTDAGLLSDCPPYTHHWIALQPSYKAIHSMETDREHISYSAMQIYCFAFY